MKKLSTEYILVILRDYLAGRDELYGEIKEAQKEYRAGKGKAGKPDDIMAEILS